MVNNFKDGLRAKAVKALEAKEAKLKATALSVLEGEVFTIKGVRMELSDDLDEGIEIVFIDGGPGIRSIHKKPDEGMGVITTDVEGEMSGKSGRKVG